MNWGEAREVSGSSLGGDQEVRYQSSPLLNSPQLQIQVQVCESPGESTPGLMLALAMVRGGTICPSTCLKVTRDHSILNELNSREVRSKKMPTSLKKLTADFLIVYKH